MSGKIIVSLTCPHCGGTVESEEGEELVICSFCNSAFALTTDEGIGKIMYRLDVTREKAESRLKEWMKKGPKAKDLVAASEITEAYPIYLPFWRVVGRGKACVCGEEIHRNEKDNTETRIPHESLVNREFRFSDVACDTGDLGISTIRIPDHAVAIPFNDEAIVTFGVTESRDDAYERGVSEIKLAAISAARKGMDEVFISRAFFFKKAFNLVYYPFWILRYTYQDRTYFAVLDGITSAVVSGRAPGNAGSQSTAAALGGTAAGVALGGGILLGFMLGAIESICFGFIGGLVVAVFILMTAYRRFRYGDEILEGVVKGIGLRVGKSVNHIETNHENTYDYYN